MSTLGKTRVVHVSDNVPGAVYIGRAMPRQGLKKSPWANPYKIGKDGTRAEVIEKYKRSLNEFAANGGPLDAITAFIALSEIVGQPLACWCRHDGEERTEENACHGDVLCDLIHELGLESTDADDLR